MTNSMRELTCKHCGKIEVGNFSKRRKVCIDCSVRRKGGKIPRTDRRHLNIYWEMPLEDLAKLILNKSEQLRYHDRIKLNSQYDKMVRVADRRLLTENYECE